jgi:adenosylcobinamide kinase/adenosylcobinamide-phosphate guanylyltransferase
MKTLFIGGVKSGKSRLAEAHILGWRDKPKPYYLATTELHDEEMQQRIEQHRKQRHNTFITVEEPVKLLEVLESIKHPVLIECVTLWINNMLYHQKPEYEILQELEAIMRLPHDLVLVQNEVGCGVIADNPLARQFVDLSGKAAQIMADYCDQVFFCTAGLKMQLK